MRRIISLLLVGLICIALPAYAADSEPETEVPARGVRTIEVTIMPDMVFELLYADGAYKPFGGFAWLDAREACVPLMAHTELLDEASATFDELRAQTMPNGHVSVRPDTNLLFDDMDVLFSPTYVFSDAGLYACDLKSVSSDAEIEQDDFQDAVEDIIQKAFSIKEASSLGDKAAVDALLAEPIDFANDSIEVVWLGENDTFLKITASKLKSSFILEIQTGLMEFFPMLSENLGNLGNLGNVE